jgi:hypothetical protein
MGYYTKVRWNPSTLKVAYDTTTEKVIVGGVECTTCNCQMPRTIRLSLANFADDCNTCFNDDTYLVNIHEVAAALNGNSYDIVWDGRGGAVCEWDNSNLSAYGEAGSYGHADCYDIDESCIAEHFTKTITYDYLSATINFAATQVTFDIRLLDSDVQLNQLFSGTLTYTSGQCCDIDGDTCSTNTVSGCGTSSNRHPCPDSGEVTIDFI